MPAGLLPRPGGRDGLAGSGLEEASLPQGACRTAGGVATIGVSNLLACRPDLPHAVGTQFLDVGSLIGTGASTCTWARRRRTGHCTGEGCRCATATGQNDRMTNSGSVLSLWSQDSVLSIGSVGSVLSVGSIGSALSVGSIGSALSVGSIGSAQSLISTGSWLSTGSLFSAQSRWSVLSWRANGGFLTAGAVGAVGAAAGGALLLARMSRRAGKGTA